jgi:hypothetical protein
LGAHCLDVRKDAAAPAVHGRDRIQRIQVAPGVGIGHGHRGSEAQLDGDLAVDVGRVRARDEEVQARHQVRAEPRGKSVRHHEQEIDHILRRRGGLRDRQRRVALHHRQHLRRSERLGDRHLVAWREHEIVTEIDGREVRLLAIDVDHEVAALAIRDNAKAAPGHFDHAEAAARTRRDDGPVIAARVAMRPDPRVDAIAVGLDELDNERVLLSVGERHLGLFEMAQRQHLRRVEAHVRRRCGLLRKEERRRGVGGIPRGESEKCEEDENE